MKYSPTVTLALALAAGIAGAAVAQTPAAPEAASNTAQPMAADTQAGAKSGQPQPTEPQSNFTQTNPMLPADAGMPGTGRQKQPARGQANLQNFTPDQVKTAQEQLQAAGLYKGPTDGQMDPDTRAAIANFQQQNGMRRTATLDQPTLDRLTANRTSGSGSSAPAAPAMAPKGDQGAAPAPAGAGGTTEK